MQPGEHHNNADQEHTTTIQVRCTKTQAGSIIDHIPTQRSRGEVQTSPGGPEHQRESSVERTTRPVKNAERQKGYATGPTRYTRHSIRPTMVRGRENATSSQETDQGETCHETVTSDGRTQPQAQNSRENEAQIMEPDQQKQTEETEGKKKTGARRCGPEDCDQGGGLN